LVVVVLHFKHLRGARVNLTALQQQRIENTCSRLTYLRKQQHMQWERYFVSDKPPYVYCCLPKVACSSWKSAMLNLTGKQLSRVFSLNDSRKRDQRGNRTVLYRQGKMLLEKYYKFMIVREPLERLLSAYRDRFIRAYRDRFIRRRKQRIVKAEIRKIRRLSNSKRRGKCMLNY